MGDKVLPWGAQTSPAESARDRAHLSLAELPELKTLSDEELMARLQSGCQDAMTILFRRYHRLILSISAKILRDHAEAEDVMQDVFFETYRRAERFDPTKGKVKMWLIQLGYSRSLNRRQYLMLRGLYNQSLRRAASSNFTEPSYTPNGFHGLTMEERTRMMERALERLTRNQREAVELAFFKGLMINEIAEQMHESVTNARNHYYRGLRKIRQTLEELSSEAKERARCS